MVPDPVLVLFSSYRASMMSLTFQIRKPRLREWRDCSRLLARRGRAGMFAQPDFRGWLLFSSFDGSHSLPQHPHLSHLCLPHFSLPLATFLSLSAIFSPLPVSFFLFSWTPHIRRTCFFLISVHRAWVPKCHGCVPEGVF